MSGDALGDLIARRLWTFPPGLLVAGHSVEGFRVEAADGRAGTVASVREEPGASAVVVTLRHGLRRTYRVLPAGAVEGIDWDGHAVRLRMRRFDVESAPALERPDGPLDETVLRAFDRGLAAAGRLGGGH